MSADTGTLTARTMRATASIISRVGTIPPSGYPSAAATPALVVAIAGTPSASKMRAVAASHAVGTTRVAGPRRNDRSRSAVSAIGAQYNEVFLGAHTSAVRVELAQLNSPRWSWRVSPTTAPTHSGERRPDSPTSRGGP